MMNYSNYNLRQEVFQKRFIAPIPFLSELRVIVLQQNAKRCPKWRFRGAENLAIQIQPQPTQYISEAERARGVRQQRILFLGVAIEGGEGSVEAFQKQGQEMAQVPFPSSSPHT